MWKSKFNHLIYTLTLLSLLNHHLFQNFKLIWKNKFNHLIYTLIFLITCRLKLLLYKRGSTRRILIEIRGKL
jgi:hypothetical protein